jgi:hypothetical protein
MADLFITLLYMLVRIILFFRTFECTMHIYELWGKKSARQSFHIFVKLAGLLIMESALNVAYKIQTRGLEF